MFSHATIGANDLNRQGAFYDAVLKELGHERFSTSEEGIGYGEPEGDQVWVLKPYNGQPASVGNGTMIAFLAKTREAVDAAFAAAMMHGGVDEGAPGVRPHYHDNYYGAYLRDTEGNKICIVCHTPPHIP